MSILPLIHLTTNGSQKHSPSMPLPCQSAHQDIYQMLMSSLMEKLSCHKRAQHKGTNPLAMSMPIGTIPLIYQLSNELIKQAWVGDNASASGDFSALQHWSDHLVQIGPQYGYYPNALKTRLIVKDEFLSQTNTIFQETCMCQTQKKPKGICELHLPHILLGEPIFLRKLLYGFEKLTPFLNSSLLTSCSVCYFYTWTGPVSGHV